MKLPAFETSDDGKQWQKDYSGFPIPGPGRFLRYIAPNGRVIYYAKAAEHEETCDGCHGTGKRKSWDWDEVRS
jgi:predicted secreted acid phosphatase